jgi:hypothetical protein
MPRYYFDVRDDEEDGLVFGSLEAVHGFGG